MPAESDRRRAGTTRRSLRARLWIGAIASIAVALLVAGLGLAALFERHVERRIGAELTAQLNQIAAAVEVTPAGDIRLTRTPSDPRFEQPLSGLYWQIDRQLDGQLDDPGERGLLRSRSLWDEVIALPPDSLSAGKVHAHRLPGPGGRMLLVRERGIRLQSPAGPMQLRLAAAQDRAELTAARNAFAADLWPYLGLIALVLLLATLVQIQTGLAPLESVRRGVEAIRSGVDRRLGEEYPDEVMPLVSEVNALLDARAQAVERARAWTADLAHGLKTPLSALAADAQRLRERGQPALADDLEQLATAMRRRVERELVRARVRTGASAHQARGDVVGALHRLLRTLQRTPEGEQLDWRVEAPPAARVALVPDDLLELLGNLLENAAKWARSQVRVQVSSAGPWIEIDIADDGPGVPVAQVSRLGQRGLRLDEEKDGTGLGLAIVRDIVDACGGGLHFAPVETGGLRVRLRLPAA
ncbi:HAMP domain-containing histidine kinase [Thiohalocapsa marina]|uniref:histidine kinase n=1 Tax=Thiohalocapsa marina TaxID=424902 RepID=A0A5M8FLF5_9GAMM|nr:HAMP domain-containing sensor histidine kinase [Thiohalocapsa marina]KAA6185324.1 HAMP domain-containing histidine kinase [Thiohalocapsa marina]